MYMLAVIARSDTHAHIQKKLERHFSELQQTGFAGSPSFSTFGEVLLVFDSSSPYASYSASETGFNLRGGFKSHDPSVSSMESQIGSHASLVLEQGAEGPTFHTESDPNYPWPLFYAQSDSAVAVGNDVHAVAIALGLRDLALDSVTELISYQYVLDRSTTVQGVSRLWPGEELRCGGIVSKLPSTLKPELIFKAPDYEEGENLDIDTHLNRTFDSLVDAVSRLEVGGPDTVIQLSGGLDSRLTAVATARSGTEDINCLTMNLEDGEELIIAAEISKRFGFSHETLELPESGQDDIRTAWLLTGGQAPLHAAANNIPYYRSQLEDRDHVRIVGAWPADLLIGAVVPSFSEFADPRMTKKALKFWLADFTENVGAEQLFQNSKQARVHLKLIRKRLARQIAEPHGSTAAQRVSYWAYTHCAPVFTFLSPARMCANVLELAPVMAPEFVRNLFRLSGRDILQRNFYQKMIWEKAPELRDIRYHNTGKLLSPEYEDPTPMSWKLRALLSLPSSIYRLINRQYNHRQMKGQVPTLSVQSEHWSQLLKAHTQQPLVLSASITVDPRLVTHPFARIGISATALACAWTKEYLESFVDE